MTDFRQKAFELMAQAPLIDGHNDWLHMIRAYYDFNLDERFEPHKSLGGHVDIKRLREGKAGGIFWSLYVDCPNEADDFSDEVHFEGLRDTIQQVDLAYRIVDLYKDTLEMAHRSDDILPIFNSGKCVSLLGIEGLHQICNSSSVLRILHRLGVRYATLAHDKNNLYADSATSKAALHNGLSEQGRMMILEMNRIGMMVDLSHVSEAVMTDVLELSNAPVIFSHSSCYALVPNPRNVPDHVIKKLGKNRGILMISFIPWLTNKNQDEASVSDVVDHITHVGRMIGYDHIGLGSDFDGMPTQIKGLDDVATYVSVVSTMLERGIAPDDVKKVMGLNLIRVMKEVEEVAQTMAAAPVMEDKVKQLWGHDIRAFVRRLYPDAEHDRPRDSSSEHIDE